MTHMTHSILWPMVLRFRSSAMGFALLAVTSDNIHFTVNKTIRKHLLNCRGKTQLKQFDSIYMLIMSTRRAATYSATSVPSLFKQHGDHSPCCCWRCSNPAVTRVSGSRFHTYLLQKQSTSQRVPYQYKGMNSSK